jgi:hypothetical protein
VLGTTTLSNVDTLGIATFCNTANFLNNVHLHEQGVYVDGCNLSYYFNKLRALGSSNAFENSNVCALSNEILASVVSTLEDSVAIGSNLVVGGNLIVKGTTCMSGVAFTDIQVTNLNADGLNVIGPSVMDGDMLVYGNSTLCNNVTVGGTTSTYSLDVLSNSTLNAVTINGEASISDKLRIVCPNDDWFIYATSNVTNSNYSDLIFRSTNNTVVSFTDDFEMGTFNFTGSHRCSLAIQPPHDRETDLIGKIVVATGDYNDLDGAATITMDEAIPMVELATKNNDKRVFGVVAGFEENSSQRFFKIGNIRFDKTKVTNDRKVIINSLGEGGILVCNVNGDLHNGDLITTCDVPGYGAKQADDIIRNYTMAKITTSINWKNIETNEKLTHGKFKQGRKVIKWALVGCVYLC